MANKKLLYYIFGITVIGVIAIYYFVCLPFTKNVDQSKNTLETRKMELLNLKKRESTLKGLEESYSTYKEKIDILNNMFPKKKDISPYITSIENAASANSVIVSSLKVVTVGQGQQNQKAAPGYTQMTKKGELYELPIEVVITTQSYENMINFVGTIEKLSRFTTIDKIIIKSESSGLLSVSISIRIYVS